MEGYGVTGIRPVSGPGGLHRTEDGGGAELSRAGNIAPHQVQQDVIPPVPGIAQDLLHGGDPGAAQGVEAGALHLHRRDQPLQAVHQLPAEPAVGRCRSFRRRAQLLPGLLKQVPRHHLRRGVQPHHGGIFEGADFFLQCVDGHANSP